LGRSEGGNNKNRKVPVQAEEKEREKTEKGIRRREVQKEGKHAL